MKTPIVVVLAVSPLVVACAPDPEQERLERAIGAEYNEETGRLELLTYDSNDNGTVDVWTYMDGTAVLRAEVDANEDGLIERWEYYERGLRRAVQAMLERGASPEDLRTEVNRIRLALNPHPAGQLSNAGEGRSTGAPDPGCRVRGSEPRKNGRLKRS